MNASNFGLPAMYRILKKAGAERISDESATELGRILEDIGVEIAKNAIEDNWSHFGFNISIVIPFMSDEDRAYLFAPNKPKKKKRQTSKEKPKRGRL